MGDERRQSSTFSGPRLQLLSVSKHYPGRAAAGGGHVSAVWPPLHQAGQAGGGGEIDKMGLNMSLGAAAAQHTSRGRGGCSFERVPT